MEEIKRKNGGFSPRDCAIFNINYIEKYKKIQGKFKVVYSFNNRGLKGRN